MEGGENKIKSKKIKKNPPWELQEKLQVSPFSLSISLIFITEFSINFNSIKAIVVAVNCSPIRKAVFLLVYSSN